MQDYGTNTLYIRPDTGKEYCLRIHDINTKYEEWISLFIHIAIKDSLSFGYKKAKEHFKKHNRVE